MKIVVGGTHKDFRQWKRDNPTVKDVAWAVTPEHLYGIEITDAQDIVRLGYMSPKMEELLLTRIRTPSTGVDRK